MPLTHADIESFHRFATASVEAGSVESFDDLYLQWESRSERSDVNAEIACGLADVEAGRFAPAADVMTEIRRELGMAAE